MATRIGVGKVEGLHGDVLPCLRISGFHPGFGQTPFRGSSAELGTDAAENTNDVYDIQRPLDQGR